MGPQCRIGSGPAICNRLPALLENTASALRDRVPATGKVNEFATETADKIETTARYLREHDTGDMVAGVESMVRRNPGASLCAALAVGFLIGTALKQGSTITRTAVSCSEHTRLSEVVRWA